MPYYNLWIIDDPKSFRPQATTKVHFFIVCRSIGIIKSPQLVEDVGTN
jgi:hypothetical protein